MSHRRTHTDATVDLRHCADRRDHELVRCTIKGFIDPAPTPGCWHRMEQLTFVSCSQVHVSIATTHFLDIRVNGLRRGGRSPLYLWSPVFERVTLTGALNGLKINPECEGLARLGPEVQAAWKDALTNAYRDVDWSLDISEAQFSSAPTLEAVPGYKVRFDPHRHALVRRAALDGIDLATLPRRVALGWFLRRSPFDEVVLVSSDDPRRRQQDRDDLARLRDLGIAD